MPAFAWHWTLHPFKRIPSDDIPGGGYSDRPDNHRARCSPLAQADALARRPIDLGYNGATSPPCAVVTLAVRGQPPLTHHARLTRLRNQ